MLKIISNLHSLRLLIAVMDAFCVMRQCGGDPEHLVSVVLQLCNQRGKGVALTYCILLQIEDQIEESLSAAAEMMTPLLREVRGEIKAHEDIDANRRRERLYFGQDVCRTLPKPLVKMILEFVLQPRRCEGCPRGSRTQTPTRTTTGVRGSGHLTRVKLGGRMRLTLCAWREIPGGLKYGSGESCVDASG